MTHPVKCPVCARGPLEVRQNGGGALVILCSVCGTTVRREALEEWLAKRPTPSGLGYYIPNADPKPIMTSRGETTSP